MATQHAATRTREPITIMVPLIWHEAFKEEHPAIRDCPVPSSPVVRGVPLYALDMHTAVGKAAIHQFARENGAVRETLAEYVPEYRAQDAACMAAFYADGAPVSRRLDWRPSPALETIGTDSDLRSTKVSTDGVRPILAISSFLAIPIRRSPGSTRRCTGAKSCVILMREPSRSFSRRCSTLCGAPMRRLNPF